MIKLLIGLLFTLGSFSAFSVNILDTEGKYELINAEVGECPSEVVIDTKGESSGDFVIISQIYGSVEHSNIIHLNESKIVKAWGLYSHKYINRLEESGKIQVKVYLAETIKLKRELEYDLSKDSHLMITDSKRKKILSKCEFRKL